MKAKTAQASASIIPSASSVVDQQLARYRSMRDFDVTVEPAGQASDGTAAGLPFCIQKHAASHLHYDFRLGWNGVLKSWACAKGPSYTVSDKRLAVQVEDHPIEYGGFEGIIPAGQYGGGTVMLWDQGTWQPQPGHEDIDAGLRTGSLKFLMHGTKMHGKWALIRMGGKAATERKPNWLLIKEHDEFERPNGPAVTDAEPNSVVTGRSLDQIAGAEDHVWNSKETAGKGQAWYRNDVPDNSPRSSKAAATTKTAAKPTKTAAGQTKTEAMPVKPTTKQSESTAKKTKSLAKPANPPDTGSWSSQLDRLPKEKQPSFIAPQLAQEAATPPDGPGWLHELKLDGYRMQARKDGSRVQMLTRSGIDWTARVSSIAAEVAKVPAETLTFDGEVVVLAPNGTTNFADLQASFQEGARNPLTYFCFDLLHLDGRSTRELPLLERKALLGQLLSQADPAVLTISEHLEAGGGRMFHHACELHAEGIVSKRAQGRYRAGRGADWLKLKCLHEQEFVIGGYTHPSNGSQGIGSLLLGYYANAETAGRTGKAAAGEAGKLTYAGRTGTGFTQKISRALRQQLQSLEVNDSAFEQPSAEARRGAHWVQPELVAQVRFATWTTGLQVRQAAFLGLREDKPAAEVRREDSAPRPKGSANTPKPAPPEQPHPQSRAKDEDSTSASTPPSPVSKRRAPEATKTAAVPAARKIAAESEHAPVRLTHPQKLLDPESGVTKQMLADYLWAVSERMLPHIVDRPLSLVRCPEGVTKETFYQKHVTSMMPPGLGGVDVPDKKTGAIERYITLPPSGPAASTRALREAIASMAQMSVLEVHPWGSRNDSLERPDRLIFDLDPDEALAWPIVTAAALELRALLRMMRLESFVKTTGGKGLHIVVPIEPKPEWPAIKDFCHATVNALERANPKLYLTKMTKSARAGKIYLDYLRNERGATAVAPYSTRARAGVGCAVPLNWTELEGSTRPIFQVANFPDWRSRLKKDPWKALSALKQAVGAIP